MKIAILGAPDTGKTKLANRLANRFNRAGDLGKWKVIDGYVESLQKRTGLPFGAASTFPHNIAIIADRWVREMEANVNGYNTITCGTIYESILYSTFSTLFTSTDEYAMVYDQMFFKAMLEALGGLEQRTYDYDAIFRLEWTPEQVQVGDNTWEAVVNAKLPEALDGFNKYALLLNGTDTQKARFAEKVVRTIWEAAQLAENDQRAVRDGDSPSEGSEHQPESLPDVRSDSD